MSLHETGTFKELEGLEGNYLTFNFVLRKHTFEFALEKALENQKNSELILIMTTETLRILRKMFVIKTIDDNKYQINTKFGSFNIDVEEELMDNTICFQKIVRKIEEKGQTIQQTVSSVVLNFCLPGDKTANIVGLKNMKEAEEYFQKRPEVKQILNTAMTETINKFLGIEDEKDEGKNKEKPKM